MSFFMPLRWAEPGQRGIRAGKTAARDRRGEIFDLFLGCQGPGRPLAHRAGPHWGSCNFHGLAVHQGESQLCSCHFQLLLQGVSAGTSSTSHSLPDSIQVSWPGVTLKPAPLKASAYLSFFPKILYIPKWDMGKELWRINCVKVFKLHNLFYSLRQCILVMERTHPYRSAFFQLMVDLLLTSPSLITQPYVQVLADKTQDITLQGSCIRLKKKLSYEFCLEI